MKTISACIVLVLLAVAHVSEAAITCGAVDGGAAPCIMFAQGKGGAVPPTACCTGLKKVLATVKTVDDKKAACRCLKAGATKFGGVQDKFLSQIPGACKINVGFPISSKTNCETIH